MCAPVQFDASGPELTLVDATGPHLAAHAGVGDFNDGPLEASRTAELAFGWERPAVFGADGAHDGLAHRLTLTAGYTVPVDGALFAQSASDTQAGVDTWESVLVHSRCRIQQTGAFSAPREETRR